jgi:hypothetical protein
MNIYPVIHNPDIIAVVASLEDQIVSKVMNEISRNGALKIGFGVTVALTRTVEGNNEYSETITRNGFRTTFFTSTTKADVVKFLQESVALIVKNIEEFCSHGSGWAVNYVDVLHLTIDKYVDMRGGSYIKSPQWIINKKCCINVRNVDNQCFRYALTAAVKPPAAHKDRVSYYNSPECKNLFNLDGIPYPTPICSRIYKKFEKQNPRYRLYVYKCNTLSKSREGVEPCYISSFASDDTREIIDLLILCGQTEVEVNKTGEIDQPFHLGPWLLYQCVSMKRGDELE